MRAGKIASLFLAGLFGAMASVVAILLLNVPGLHAKFHLLGPFMQALYFFGLLSLVILLILFPIGASIDRAIVRLRRHIEQRAEGSSKRYAIPRPRWLAPLVGAMTAAIERYQDDRRILREELRDVASRHSLAETKNRRSEAVLHTLRDAVFVLDGQGRLAMINETAMDMFHLQLNRCLHLPLDEIVPSAPLCELIQDIRQTGEVGALRHEEIRIPIPAEGEGGVVKIATFDACIMCLERTEGEAGGVVVVLHDLTPQRELSDLKTDFVAKASHELRTPLSSIRAYVEMLIDGEAEDEASRQQFYRIVHEEAERLSLLIDNMLNISRIEAGMVQIETQQVKVGALIEQITVAMEPAARERHLTLDYRVASDDLVVEAGRDMLYQVLLNLLSNAVKYTPKGGTVIISAEEDRLSRSVVFSVADTGLGIPDESQGRIFEKFYRLESSQRMAKGTGLGLTLCKHIVETLHHGDIGVESRVGMGAKFWFSIPIRFESTRTAA